MGCSKCGNDDKILVAVPGRHPICQTCYMHLNPFKMELIYVRTHHCLYNRTLEMEETIEIEQFLHCGWFQRKRAIRGNHVYYLLEYHGKVKCGRCVNFCWPLSMKERCKFYDMCEWQVKHHQNFKSGGLKG